MNRMLLLLAAFLCTCHPTLTAAQAFVPIRRDQTFFRNTALTAPTSTPRVPVQPSRNPIFLQASLSPIKEDEKEKSAIDPVELAGLAVWMGALSTFLLRNNFVGPWPAIISTVPEDVWLFIHALAGMLFGGGIILTTCVEWLVAKSKDPSVLTFWFEKVPGLDLSIVLPAISVAIVSGTGLASVRYGGLGEAPIHIKASLHLLVFFAIWWASTSEGPICQWWNDAQSHAGIPWFNSRNSWPQITCVCHWSSRFHVKPFSSYSRLNIRSSSHSRGSTNLIGSPLRLELSPP
jgi:hypothetical protein